MEPRSSGLVSHGLQPPNHKAYKQERLARIVSKPEDVERQAFEERHGVQDERWKDPEMKTPVGDFSMGQIQGNKRRGKSKRASEPVTLVEKGSIDQRPLSR